MLSSFLSLDFSHAQKVAVADLIKSKKGVVQAEDLAPYLDPPDVDSSINNQEWLIPWLISLGGEPIVSSDGNICYSFQNMQHSVHIPNDYVRPEVLIQPLLKFSSLSSTSVFGFSIFGLIYMTLASTLSSIMKQIDIKHLVSHHLPPYSISGMFLRAVSQVFIFYFCFVILFLVHFFASQCVSISCIISFGFILSCSISSPL